MLKRILPWLFAVLMSSPVAAQTVISETTCPGTGCDIYRVTGAGVSFQVTGTFVGTLAFKQSNDASTWADLTVYAQGSTTGITTTTTTGFYAGATTAKYVRVGFSAFSSGSATIYKSETQARFQTPSAGGAISGTTGTFTDLVTITKDAIGVTPTPGLLLTNTTAAAAGAQQFSPESCFEGRGWKTASTAGSQAVRGCIDNSPVQGSSAPTGLFNFKFSINGGAESTAFTVASNGSIAATAGISLGASNSLSWSASSSMKAPSDGVITLYDTAQTAFTRLQFGGTTSSYPAIKRNSAALNFRLADDSADAAITSAAVGASGDVTITKGGAFIKTNGTSAVGGILAGWQILDNSVLRWEFINNSSNDFKLNRYNSSGVFVDQPLTVNGSTGTVTISTELNRTGGITYLLGTGSSTTGLGVDANGNVSQMSRTPNINTGSMTTTAVQSGQVISNRGDADGSSIALLNDPAEGIFYTIVVHAAQTITVTASAGETLKYGTSTCGTSLTSNAIGSSVTLYVSGSGSGAQWITTSAMGTWTCNP